MPGRDGVAVGRRAIAVGALATALVVVAVAIIVAGNGDDGMRVSVRGTASSTTTTEATTTTTTSIALIDPSSTLLPVVSPTTTLRKPPPTTTSTAPPPVIADGTWRVGTEVAPGWYVQTGTGPCTWTVTVPDGRATSQLSEWMAAQAFQLRDGSRIATSGCRLESAAVAIDNNGGATIAIAEKRGPTPRVPVGTFLTGRDIHYGHWAVDGFDEHRSSDCPKEGCEATCVVRVRTAGGLQLSEPRRIHAGEDDLKFSTLPPMVLEVMGESCPRWKIAGPW